MKQDLDISNVERNPKRDRIRIERKKYDELVAERDRYRSLNNEHFIQLQQAEAARDRLKAEKENLFQENLILKADLHMTKESCRKTNSDKIVLDMDLKEARKSIVNWEDRVIDVSDKLSTIRDQRDMARFIAALLLIVSVGFAVAVWLGKLIPVT